MSIYTKMSRTELIKECGAFEEAIEARARDLYMTSKKQRDKRLDALKKSFDEIIAKADQLSMAELERMARDAEDALSKEMGLGARWHGRWWAYHPIARRTKLPSSLREAARAFLRELEANK